MHIKKAPYRHVQWGMCKKKPLHGAAVFLWVCAGYGKSSMGRLERGIRSS